MKAQYHKENEHYRVVQRGKLFFAQRFMRDKGVNKGFELAHLDRFDDMHRGTDHETAQQQVGAAVARAKKEYVEEKLSKLK